MRLQVWILTGTFLLSAVAALPAAETDIAKTVESFASQYCYDCHDNDTQKGDFNFAALSRDLSNPKTAIQWQDLLDLVRGNEMPPKKKARPAAADLEKFTATVEAALRHEAEKATDNDRIAIRRLVKESGLFSGETWKLQDSPWRRFDVRDPPPVVLPLTSLSNLATTMVNGSLQRSLDRHRDQPCGDRGWRSGSSRLGAGGGSSQASGIAVTTGVLLGAAAEINAGFSSRLARGGP
ncbi:MAG: hypothetical protein HC814_03425 [Rhodobacteraceae bacterium]|nr:hypothetical protein [Paracoccaceae bacterium]